jgi:hypothetical protein
MSNADDTIAADIMAVEAIIFHVTPSYRKSLSLLRSAPLHPGKEEVSSTFPHTRAEVRRADALHGSVARADRGGATHASPLRRF